MIFITFFVTNSENIVAIREDPSRGVIAEGAKEITIHNAEDALKLFETASKHRHVSSTNSNDQSSRSHMIFSLFICSTKTIIENDKVRGLQTITKVQTSRLNLVDLAGSERQKSTQTSGI